MQKLFTSFLLITALSGIKVSAQNAAKITCIDYDKYYERLYACKTKSQADKIPTSIKFTISSGKNMARVIFKFDILNYTQMKKNGMLYFIVYKVTEGKENYAYDYSIPVPSKNGFVYVFSDFTEGSYKCYLRDKDNESTVYATANYAVGGNSTTTTQMSSGGKSGATLDICKTVDDNWNPVGKTSKIKAGTCVQFLFKGKEKSMNDFMMWVVEKQGDDGNYWPFYDLLQRFDNNEGWRFVSTDDICMFTSPGKYKVYFMQKDEFDSHHGASENYWAMTELTVE